MTAPGGTPGEPTTPDPEAERRRQELEAARSAKLFAGTEGRTALADASPGQPQSASQPDLAGLGLAPQPATPSAQQRQQAFLDATPDKRTVSPDRVAAPASPNIL
ncbi:Conjugative transfer protein TrbI [Candidatus Paraburkholderia calva]|nr:Conjugative transfer protein TrbI [Candidatus Paraburkholderia calva]